MRTYLVDLPSPSKNRIAPQSASRSQQATVQEPASNLEIRPPTQPDVPPLTPWKRSKKGPKKSPSPIVDEEFETQKSGPALFSQEWINDLQNWVDGIQRRS